MKAAVHKEKSVHKSEELIVFLRRTVISCLHACDEWLTEVSDKEGS